MITISNREDCLIYFKSRLYSKLVWKRSIVAQFWKLEVIFSVIKVCKCYYDLRVFDSYTAAASFVNTRLYAENERKIKYLNREFSLVCTILNLTQRRITRIAGPIPLVNAFTKEFCYERVACLLPCWRHRYVQTQTFYSARFFFIIVKVLNKSIWNI